jgi:hypothetical protein
MVKGFYKLRRDNLNDCQPEHIAPGLMKNVYINHQSIA